MGGDYLRGLYVNYVGWWFYRGVKNLEFCRYSRSLHVTVWNSKFSTPT
jgi:hypothetical protein